MHTLLPEPFLSDPGCGPRRPEGGGAPELHGSGPREFPIRINPFSSHGQMILQHLDVSEQAALLPTVFRFLPFSSRV